MSMSFYVKKPSNKEVLSVSEILEFSGLEQFSVDDSEEGFEEFMKAQISEHECVILGIDELTPFGFELWYDSEISSYIVRLTTPATHFDWKIALGFLQILARKNGEKIISEHGDEFLDDEISKINFKADITYGIEVIKKSFKEQESKELVKFGVSHPIVFDERIVDEILNAKSSDEIITKYGEFCQEQQFSGGYFAKQMFYQNDKGWIFGAYVLSEGVDTVLPFEPSVEFCYKDSLKDSDVGEYKIIFMGSINGSEDDFDGMGEVDYHKFMANLPKDRYRFLDAKYIHISAPTNEEIRNWAKLGD